MRRRFEFVLLTILLLGCGGCFTGVESTPRIGDAELRRSFGGRKADNGPEYDVLRRLTLRPLRTWAEGDIAIVTDAKIRLVLTPAEQAWDILPGQKLVFAGLDSALSLSGEKQYVANFAREGQPGVSLHYTIPGGDAEAVLPFSVDPSLAREADSLLRLHKDKAMWIKTPLWYDPASEALTNGFRHILVSIDSVRPGNDVYPLRVFFHNKDAAEYGSGEHMVFMTLQDANGAKRDFPSLFTFTDPRKNWPEISESTWRRIVRSQVQEGMNRDECRLALGSPAAIDRVPLRTGDAERWTYSDGQFLIFNPEGILIRYRL